MTLDDLSSMAEITGAIATVLTLAYLAIQVRQNSTQLQEATRIAKISSLDHTVEMFSRFREMLTEPRNSELYVRGLDSFTSLSSAEQVQFRAIIEEYVFAYHGMYVRYVHGDLDEPTWIRRLPVVASILDQTGGREWWESRKAIFPEDFVTTLEMYARSNPAK
ncbi:MAG: hypothetical protein V7709_08060 [Halioglobus sp.]